ncbi:rhodopsin [Dunckerocampus dactyliophorus]|uniref:rhodopsin n=1 Tax=Dunckerocampus dactyliophorus TaxID=161453 RepID=UPI002406D7B9|nr:rhodopsin [Dunckerocampus dactyliophorus]
MDVEELIESIIRASMFIAGVIGNNWLAISSIPSKRSGLCTNELLFINLAVSNLITNYLVDLPDTIADFAESWFLGEAYCGIFRFCADLSETSSIFTTFFISVFWHQKLVGSLKRGGAPVKLDNLCLVFCLLAGSWTTALVFSIPHFFFVTVDVTNETEKDCIDVFPNAISRKSYDIFYLTLANALPLAGMLFASGQIVVTLLQNQQRIRSHPDSGLNKNKVKEKAEESEVNTVFGPSRGTPSHIYSGIPASASCPDTGQASSLDSDPARAPPNQSKPSQAKGKPNSNSQVRAAKSVVAVASVFLVCWLTHLLLRITNNFHTSSLMVEVASYIAASYTCIIPYIFLHGAKKLTCSCKR